MSNNILLKGYLNDNEASLVKGGADYFTLLEQLICRAKISIHLQVYILEGDHTGLLLARWLKEAAGRGVDVYVLADGYASQSLSSSYVEELSLAGIRFKYFQPLFRSRNFYFGRRLHHKLVVVDDEYALVGGINISDRYHGLNGIPAWLDYAIYVRGAVVSELAVLAWKTWNGFSVPDKYYRPIKPDLTLLKSIVPVRMRRNDWVRRRNQISASYFQILRHAEKEIILMSSYFIPGRAIRRNLSAAAKRGVKIKLVLAGLSDVKLAKNAERFMYDWLLRRGIEVYEYNRSVLHAKVAVADGEWLTVGSYNINDISAFASIELNLDVRSLALAAELRGQLEKIMEKDCIRVMRESGKRYYSSSWHQFICWLSYRVFRLTFFLFTFYYKQQR